MNRPDRLVDSRHTTRIIDPRDTTRIMSERQSGVATQRDLSRVSDKLSRSGNHPPQNVKRIGFDVPTAGANQTISSTTYAAVTGSAFDLNLGGPDAQTWSVDLSWTATFTAFGAIDDAVVIRPAVSWDGGATYLAPDIDRSATLTVVQAYHTVDYRRAKSTSDGVTLHCRCVFACRASDKVKVRLEAKVFAGGDTATLELTTDEVTPRCVGMATAYEGGA